MKFTANNHYSDKTCVTLEYTLAEQDDMELGITATARGLAEVIAELLKRTCETLPQAEVLTDVVIDQMQRKVNHYIKNDFSNDLERKQERELYEYMRECFYRFLHDIGLTPEKWNAKYRGSKTLTLEPILLDSGLIAIMFSNGTVGNHLVTLDPRNRDTAPFNRALSEAFIIATVAGDVIFCKDRNPIRELPVGKNADGGLSDAIDHLLSKQQEEDKNGL